MLMLHGAFADHHHMVHDFRSELGPDEIEMYDGLVVQDRTILEVIRGQLAFALLDRAGHLAAYDQPVLVTALVNEWLDRLE